MKIILNDICSFLVLVIIFLGLSEYVYADAIDSKHSNDNQPSISQIHTDAVVKEDGSLKIGVAPIPIIFYTPETSLAAGAGVVFTFRNHERPNDNRPNNLQMMGVYTLKNQMMFNVSPDIYFNDKYSEFKLFMGYPQQYILSDRRKLAQSLVLALPRQSGK
jgi:hypothetical protein